MLHTRVCELLGIEYPVIQAAMSPLTTPELVAAVSNAGVGQYRGRNASPADLRQRLARTRADPTSTPRSIMGCRC
jgi:NAD(P)H-dependent flavin oxidoreductase YrpB (nitropropane dioxygenase family)